MKALIPILTSGLVLASAAVAAPLHVRDGASADQYVARAGYGLAIAPDMSACVKSCDADTNPCDPPLFKRADGRCSAQ